MDLARKPKPVPQSTPWLPSSKLIKPLPNNENDLNVVNYDSNDD